MPATITPDTLNGPALQVVCRQLRDTIMSIVNGAMFSKYERLNTAFALGRAGDDPARLQTWIRNLHRLRREREAQVCGADYDGEYTTGFDTNRAA